MIESEREFLLLVARASELESTEQANLKKSLVTEIMASGNIGDIPLQEKLLNSHARTTIKERAFKSIAKKASEREREMRWGGI